jgi:hypothetical protein
VLEIATDPEHGDALSVLVTALTPRFGAVAERDQPGDKYRMLGNTVLVATGEAYSTSRMLYEAPMTKTELPAAATDDPALARLLDLVGDHDTVDYATIAQRAGIPARTLDRQLSALLADGVLFRWGRGVYGRHPAEPQLNSEGQELLGLFRDSDADAHLTGFDVLAPYARQFVYAYTHLVYCHPPHLSGLATELSAADWQLLPAGRHVHLGGPRERTVIVRGQTHNERRYPVRNHLAMPEKAWVDLLREVRRSRLGIDYGELGRILRSMERTGIPIARFRTYARSVGYIAWLEAALGERSATNAEQSQLAAGYAA